MAALPLRPGGPLIVVGDHRQMPPIVQHDWDGEPRRTFREYEVYASLFDTLRRLDPPMIRFAESFRLHAAIADFLRREVYRHDGIPFHSRKTDVLPSRAHPDETGRGRAAPRVPADAGRPRRGVQPDAEPLRAGAHRADPPRRWRTADGYGLDAETGVGVVVPHRAQRAALQQAFPGLCVLDPASGLPPEFGDRHGGAVPGRGADGDPGQRHGERPGLPAGLQRVPARPEAADGGPEPGEAEDDPGGLPEHLLELFSPDEEVFLNSQLWKNLLLRTCTTPLWEGERGREAGCGVGREGGPHDGHLSAEPQAGRSPASPAGPPRTCSTTGSSPESWTTTRSSPPTASSCRGRNWTACYRTFRSRFGPDVLARLDGEELLETMHAHGNKDSLVYWLEFKNDEEFPARFGSISGGSAFKFGIFRGKETGTWVTGSPQNVKQLTVPEAVEIARRHRDQLIRGAERVGTLPELADDAEYRRLQDGPRPDRTGGRRPRLGPQVLQPARPRAARRLPQRRLPAVPPRQDAPGAPGGGRSLPLRRSLRRRRPRTRHPDQPPDDDPQSPRRGAARLLADRHLGRAAAEEPVAAHAGRGLRGDRLARPGRPLGLREGRPVQGEAGPAARGAVPGSPQQAGRAANQILNFAKGIAEGDAVLACDGADRPRRRSGHRGLPPRTGLRLPAPPARANGSRSTSGRCPSPRGSRRPSTG